MPVPIEREPPGPPTSWTGWKWWAPFALRSPTRLAMLALVAVAMVVSLSTRPRIGPDRPKLEATVLFLGGAALVMLVFQWSWFWSGRGVRAAVDRWSAKQGDVSQSGPG